MSRNRFEPAGADCPFSGLTFLEPTPATALTCAAANVLAEVRHMAARKGVNTLRHAVSVFIHERLETKEENKEILYRKRSASRIIQDGFVTGCSDVALVFVALARALDIPARIVDSFAADWLFPAEGSSEWNPRDISGHVFVDIFVDNHWCPYEPETGFPPDNSYSRTQGEGRPRVKCHHFARGQDFAALFLQDPVTGLYRPRACTIDSYDELRFLAGEYRRRVLTV
jgi:hypothetical protein